jgi:hypothetical protein
MKTELFKVFGQAGVGGLAIGALLVTFWGIIHKNIFPKLSPQNSDRILRQIVGATTTVSTIAILAWAYVTVTTKADDRAAPNVSQITNGAGSPAISGVTGNVTINMGTPKDEQTGSIPFEDAEVHGLLKPAKGPTPPNACDATPLPSGSMKILIGDNAFAWPGFGKFTAIQIGACQTISMERTPLGISVDADVYDELGRLIAQIRNNEIMALKGDNYSPKQFRDGSSLTIKDAHGQEVFNVLYINPSTVRVRGVFGCPGHKTIAVKDDQPVPGLFMHDSCLSGRVAIRVN